MSTKILKLCIALLLCMAANTATRAQLTYVTTLPPLTGGNGQNGVTFNVQAFSDVEISEIWASFGSTSSQTVEVWYNPSDSVNGVPTVSTGNGWVQLGSVTFAPATAGYSTIELIPISGLSVIITAGTTCGFFISSTQTINYTTGPSASGTEFSDANMSINTGTNAGYGGNPPSSSFYIRQYNGKIGYDLAGPPCPQPTGLSATNVLSSSANVSWNPVSGSIGYDYIIDQNATYTTGVVTNTTATTASATGLLPSTTYYLHVRNYCTAIKKSKWSDYTFTTLPPCDKPSAFNVVNITPTTADISWAPLASALSWDYVVDQTTADPINSTGATNTLTNGASLTGLAENTTYYVHIRANCTGEISDWSLDSFLTPIPCRAPVIKTDYVNAEEAVAYWEDIPTAYTYEYAITKSASPPQTGTKYAMNNIHMSALLDGVTYYVHVRSYCNSIGIEGVSPWGTASFKTFPLNVSSTIQDGFTIAAYPNPVTDMLNISFTGEGISNKSQLQLTDISGKTLQQINIGNNEASIDMSKYAPGVYLLRYTDDVNNKIIKVEKQ
ncbi:MAG: T9SS type A sorting domain-containing protein [Sphingobacteriales bacterium]|nr:MAG: T9SS type A sorting domain-containing protein [Sphingobacteriales bacterium]